MAYFDVGPWFFGKGLVLVHENLSCDGGVDHFGGVVAVLPECMCLMSCVRVRMTGVGVGVVGVEGLTMSRIVVLSGKR
jgi:hypothetical protein